MIRLLSRVPTFYADLVRHDVILLAVSSWVVILCLLLLSLVLLSALVVRLLSLLGEHYVVRVSFMTLLRLASAICLNATLLATLLTRIFQSLSLHAALTLVLFLR